MTSTPKRRWSTLAMMTIAALTASALAGVFVYDQSLPPRETFRKVNVGMTEAEVLDAVGHPWSKRRTSSTEAIWTYNCQGLETFIVEFKYRKVADTVIP
jgi:hypothetical protein